MAVTCLDPGLSNCTTQIILVNINGDEAENINPTQQLGEHMGLFYVHFIWWEHAWLQGRMLARTQAKLE